MPLWCITHLWFSVCVAYVGVIEHIWISCCLVCGCSLCGHMGLVPCPVRESVSHKQPPVQDRHDREPGTVPKTHNRQLGHRNPPADNKIQKQQPWQTAHRTAWFRLYIIRRRIHRTYNRNTTLPNNWNYTTTGTTTSMPQSRDSKRNTRLTRTTHTQLDGAQQHTLNQGRPANSESTPLIHEPNKPHRTIRRTLYNVASV